MKIVEFLQKIKNATNEKDLEEIAKELANTKIEEDEETEILEDDESEGEDMMHHEADRQREEERDV